MVRAIWCWNIDHGKRDLHGECDFVAYCLRKSLDMPQKSYFAKHSETMWSMENLLLMIKVLCLLDISYYKGQNNEEINIILGSKI